MNLLEESDLPDLVGYEWELAEELCRRHGRKVILEVVGTGGGGCDEREGGPLRVIRQIAGEGECVRITCAHENWQALG